MKKKYSTIPYNLLPFLSLFKLTSDKLALLFIFFLCGENNYAQAPENESSQSQRILHIDPFMASMRSATGNMAIASRIEYLIREVHPSIYVSSTNVKKYGENPVCLFTDSKSLNPTVFSNLLNDDIEILIIKINDSIDLNSQIDLSLFANYPTLKYIYILSTIETTENDILLLVRNNNPNYNVFYNILKAS